MTTGSVQMAEAGFCPLDICDHFSSLTPSCRAVFGEVSICFDLLENGAVSHSPTAHLHSRRARPPPPEGNLLAGPWALLDGPPIDVLTAINYVVGSMYTTPRAPFRFAVLVRAQCPTGGVTYELCGGAATTESPTLSPSPAPTPSPSTTLPTAAPSASPTISCATLHQLIGYAERPSAYGTAAWASMRLWRRAVGTLYSRVLLELSLTALATSSLPGG